MSKHKHFHDVRSMKKTLHHASREGLGPFGKAPKGGPPRREERDKPAEQRKEKAQ